VDGVAVTKLRRQKIIAEIVFTLIRIHKRKT